jgi:hypothetical protein
MTNRRAFLTATAALAASGCATRPLGTPESTSVAAPQWRAGDAWIYRRTDGYTKLDAGSPVTRRVAAVGSAGIRITETTAAETYVNDALWATPIAMLSGTLSEYGPIVGRFEPPLRFYDFPLVSGKRWNQQLHRIDSAGFRYFMTIEGWVEGWDDVQVSGRSVRVIAVRREMLLGQLPPALGTNVGNAYRSDTEWYSPELGSFVRLNQMERYQPNRSNFGTAPGSWFVWEMEKAGS